MATIEELFLPVLGKLKLKKVKKLIGSGKFGSVYLVEGNDNADYAVKVMNASQKQLIDREWDVSQRVRGKSNYLVQTLDRCQEGSNVFLKMEYCNNGSLADIFPKLGFIPQTITFVWQLLSGINVLHQNNVVHRDLKPDNILLNKETVGQGVEHLTIKITDFGLSRSMDEGGAVDTIVGTQLYMSPEVFEVYAATTWSYDSKTDVWACGLILHQMISKGTHLFSDVKNMLQLVSAFNRPFLRPPELNKETVSTSASSSGSASSDATQGVITDEVALNACWRLLEHMVCTNPKLRLSAEEALRSELFAQWGPPEAKAILFPPDHIGQYVPPIYPLDVCPDIPNVPLGGGPSAFSEYTEYKGSQLPHENKFVNAKKKERPASNAGSVDVRHQVVFMMDATFSMKTYLEAVRIKIKDMVSTLLSDSEQVIDRYTKNKPKNYNLFFELAAVCYRDFEDKNQFEILDFTEDIDQFMSFLAQVQPSGGGDVPEDIIGAFLHALYGLGSGGGGNGKSGAERSLSWEGRGPVAKRSIVVVADAPAHGYSFYKDDWSLKMEKEWNIIFRTLRNNNISLSIMKVNLICEIFHNNLVDLGKTFGVEVKIEDSSTAAEPSSSSASASSSTTATATATGFAAATGDGSDGCAGGDGGGGSSGSSDSSSSGEGGGGGDGGGGSGGSDGGADAAAVKSMDHLAMHLSGMHARMTKPAISESTILTESARFMTPDGAVELINAILERKPTIEQEQFVEVFQFYRMHPPNALEMALFKALAPRKK